MSKSKHTGGGIRNPLIETLAFHTAPGVVFSAASVICLPEPRAAPLDGVGGWVFTRRIEHTFEHRVILMVQEVPL